MKASEAQRLVRQHRARRNIDVYYAHIKEAASVGKTSLTYTSKLMDEDTVEILLMDGYKVEEQREETDPPPYHKSRRIGWVVSWD